MIYIGIENEIRKKEIIEEYCKDKNIEKVFIFTPSEFQVDYNLVYPHEYIPYTEIIMYRTFYRLLEVIDKKTLLVFNECMRTQNRSDLTYNCAHHYCAQTPHKIVFEYFPFIAQHENFMILLDFINKGKYKGKSFDFSFIKEEEIYIEPKAYQIETIDYIPTPRDIAEYEYKKKELFENLGQGDPDTIPRQLHVYVGRHKKKFIEKDKKYVARNKRFGLNNIITYNDIKFSDRNEYIIIDFPHRQIEFNDFLKKTNQKKIVFINSNLKVDLYYLNSLKDWLERLGEFYDKAKVY